MEETQQAYVEFNRNERPFVAFDRAIGGALPAAALYFLFAKMGGFLLVMLLLHLAGCWLLQLNPFMSLLAPVCAGVAICTAKVKLDQLQEFALGQAEIGLLGSHHAR